MAYFNRLAAVPEADINRLREDPTVMLRPSMVSGASHLIVMDSWVKVQPLCSLLARALDGGEVLRPDLWHPFRTPRVHGPDAVRELAERVGEAATEAGLSNLEDDWLSAEVGRLLRVFRHAAAAGECVVSALDPPTDEARASKVRRLWALQVTPNQAPGRTPSLGSLLVRLRSLVIRR